MKQVLGALDTMHWSPDMDNEQSKKFVADYRKKHGNYPSFYSAQAYDAIHFIKSAVDAVNGDVSNTDALRAAMVKADYKSVRGPYKYGHNHMPVQNFYLREVVEGPDGAWTHKIVKTVYENHADPHGKNCKM